jgi:hypothetical protein
MDSTTSGTPPPEADEMPLYTRKRLATLLIALGSPLLACDEGLPDEPAYTSHDQPQAGLHEAEDETFDDPPFDSDAVDEEPGSDRVGSTCDQHASCFSWCGARYRDGRCLSAAKAELTAAALGPVLCDPTIVEVDGTQVRGVGDETRRAARCFLQVLRHGHEGVAELYWHDLEQGRMGHLIVQGLGPQMARLEMRLDGVEPDCGSSIAMSSPRAHLRDALDPLFGSCLDAGADLDLERCILGPARGFFEDHDIVFDVAFPWLSGACFPG